MIIDLSSIFYCQRCGAHNNTTNPGLCGLCWALEHNPEGIKQALVIFAETMGEIQKTNKSLCITEVGISAGGTDLFRVKVPPV